MSSSASAPGIAGDKPETAGSNRELIAGLVRPLVASQDIDVPVLPEIAARVVALASSEKADTTRLTRLIIADQSLATHVMRVSTMAVHQPATPISSLPQAITWLGLSAVADIAFTVAMQGKILNVPGHKALLLAMWREAVASGLWAREIAGVCHHPADSAYLQGLLHRIGRPIVVNTVADVARRARVALMDEDLLAIVAEFEREVGELVVQCWRLPPSIAAVVRHWQDLSSATEFRIDAAITGLAHRLAHYALDDDSDAAREAICADERLAELNLTDSDLDILFNRTERVLAQVRTY
jgi:HD-like signal output (HDOD) protein